MRAEQLADLHVGWPNPPSPETFLRSLRNMNAVVLAIDPTTDKVVGFVCGMTDKTLILYIWDHEVLPGYKGIEEELLRRRLDQSGDIYQINTITFPDKHEIFEKQGFAAYDAAKTGLAMTRMRMDWQDGGPHAVK